MTNRITSCTVCDMRPKRQRGMVTLVVMLFLIATVVFSLSQMLNVSSGNVIDGQRQGDSTAAFFVAESGLEKGHAIVNAAFGPTFNNTSCTSIPTAASSPYSLGRGSVSVSAVSTPATCDNRSVTPCEKCTVISSGQVGVSNRTLTQDMLLTTANGVSCNSAVSDCTNVSAPPPTWKLNLYNNYPSPAIAMFSLAAQRQGAQTGASCTNPACKLQWNINTSNGGSSVGSMGNAVSIASGGSYEIYQTLTTSYNVAEVGALFPGSSPGPSLTGRYVSGNPVPGGAAYWNDNESGNTGGTIAKANSTSGFFTNDGTWTDPATDSCTTTPAPNSKQTCTTWCYGGDTLVFGFAGSSSSVADELSDVIFDTAGQNIHMARIAKFPTSGIAGAANNVYSEIWYLRNPDYLSNATASSGGVVTGSIGATFTGALTNGSNVMAVSSITSGVLHVGDVVSCDGGGACPAVLSAGTTSIIAQTLGTTGGVGNYTLSVSCANPNCGARNDKTSSTKLEVTAVGSGYLSVGDALTGTGVTANTAVSSIVGAGNVLGTYTVNTAQTVTSTANNLTAAGSTIHVIGAAVPASGVLVSIKTGTGALPVQTRVLGSPTPTATVFKVDKTPSSRLINATICGGTCAFFQHGPSATTSFNVTKSPNTGYWGGGFMCLKGVDITPQVVTSSSAISRRWTEVIH